MFRLTRPTRTLVASLASFDLALLLAVTTHASPAAPAPREVAAAARALQTAVAQGSLPDMLAARARFAALAAAAPKSAWAHYWVAVSDWRAAPRFDEPAKVLAEKTCAEGIAEIDKAIAIVPAEGEFHALRSNLLGISLRFHPGAMMTIGPEIEAEMQRALAASPGNPRVLLLAAINTLNKPAFIGGGADKALPMFRKSQAAFEPAVATAQESSAASSAVADSTAPAWGRDDAWLWGGVTAMQLGDAATARTCYLKALEVTPGHAWVTHALLPEADKALAGDTASGK